MFTHSTDREEERENVASLLRSMANALDREQYMYDAQVYLEIPRESAATVEVAVEVETDDKLMDDAVDYIGGR